MTDNSPIVVRFADVVEATVRVSRFQKASLIGRVSTSHQRLARFAMWHVADELTGMTFNEMGRRTAIDPTAVAYGIKRASAMIAASDEAFIARRSAICAEAIKLATERAGRVEVMA